MKHPRTLAAIAGLATLLGLAAAPARADWDDYGRHGWGGGWHRPWGGYRPYYPPPPVYVRPYFPPPVLGYIPPPPAFYPPPGSVWAPSRPPPPYWVRPYAGY